MTEVQLRFARNQSIPIRDQLTTQLMLAIASGELGPGKKLPSTRALAKRFRLNPNTVSAAYQQLETAGWVESRHGSGVYVRANQHDPALDEDVLDRLVLPLLQVARTAGISAGAIRQRVDHWLTIRPKRFVFVHPEQELRAIIVQELREKLDWPVEACDSRPADIATYVEDSIFVTVPSQQSAIRGLVPAGSEMMILQMRDVDQALAPYFPIRSDVLLVIASAWQGFLQIARTVLAAASCDSDAVLFLNTRTDEWKRKLDRKSVVVCDTVTSKALPDGVRRLVFALVSDAGITRLKSCERFFTE